MKRVVLILGAVLFSVFFLSTVVSAADVISIDKFKDKKPAVNFPHKAHQDSVGDCAKCHHKDTKGAEKACFECHKAEKGDAISYKDASHKMCKDCHKDGGKGPTKCGDCHKK